MLGSRRFNRGCLQYFADLCIVTNNWRKGKGEEEADDKTIPLITACITKKNYLKVTPNCGGPAVQQITQQKKIIMMINKVNIVFAGLDLTDNVP